MITLKKHVTCFYREYGKKQRQCEIPNPANLTVWLFALVRPSISLEAAEFRIY